MLMLSIFWILWYEVISYLKCHAMFEMNEWLSKILKVIRGILSIIWCASLYGSSIHFMSHQVHLWVIRNVSVNMSHQNAFKAVPWRAIGFVNAKGCTTYDYIQNLNMKMITNIYMNLFLIRIWFLTLWWTSFIKSFTLLLFTGFNLQFILCM